MNDDVNNSVNTALKRTVYDHFPALKAIRGLYFDYRAVTERQAEYRRTLCVSRLHLFYFRDLCHIQTWMKELK